jgi:small subunit ribosomal protein S20
MANNKQAEKRNRQREKNRIRNRLVLGSTRTALRKAREAVSSRAGNVSEMIQTAVSTLDRAVSKGVMKRGTASRLIARLTRPRASA